MYRNWFLVERIPTFRDPKFWNMRAHIIPSQWKRPGAYLSRVTGWWTYRDFHKNFDLKKLACLERNIQTYSPSADASMRKSNIHKTKWEWGSILWWRYTFSQMYINIYIIYKYLYIYIQKHHIFHHSQINNAGYHIFPSHPKPSDTQNQVFPPSGWFSASSLLGLRRLPPDKNLTAGNNLPVKITPRNKWMKRTYGCFQK